MGRRVALGFIVASAVIWPAFAQVPEPKPIVPPDLEAKIEEAHRTSTRDADARRAAAILAVAARVANAKPPVPEPAPADAQGAGPTATEPARAAAETGAAETPPVPHMPPPEAGTAEADDNAPPAPDAAPAAGDGTDLAAAAKHGPPPVPVLRSTVKPPAPAKVTGPTPEDDTDLADGTADDVDFGIPRAKPKVTRVAARAPTLSRPSTNSNVQSSIRAAQLDPGGGPACEAALKSRAAFALVEAVRDKSCGAPRPLAVSTVEGVSLSTKATLRCPVATALADWTETVVKPAAKKHFRQDVAAYMIGPSYACRTRRNGSRTSRLSEHAFANAIDIAGFKLKDGTVFMVEPHHTGAKKAFQAEVRSGACGKFKTVLGPRTTPMHDDHLHLDSAPRRNGSSYCK